MTSKEKLLKALNHESGPIPLDLGGSAVSGIHCETLARLREYYGLEKRPITICEPYQMLGAIDDDLIEVLGIDVLPLWDERCLTGVRVRDFKEWRTPWGQEVLMPGEWHVTEREDGFYSYAQGDMNYPPSVKMPKTGRFWDAVDRQKPYDEDNLILEHNTEEFGDIDELTLQHLAERAAVVSATDKGVLGSFGGAAFGDIVNIPATSLKDPKGVRGVSDWYMLLASDPDFVHQIFDVQLEYVLKNLKRIYDTIGDAADICYVCGTDFGTQNGSFCSVNTFNELYAPYYKAVNNWIHENTKWKTMKHCCGSIYNFIPAMIDAGFDILNPVQWSAKDMDREALKKNYGKDIVFWGGGVNTQKTLPYGTPKEVYDEVLETCRIFGEGGGFVFNTIHNIQSRVPTENVVAMFKAFADYNKG